jgi:hypothetical protein
VARLPGELAANHDEREPTPSAPRRRRAALLLVPELSAPAERPAEPIPDDGQAPASAGELPPGADAELIKRFSAGGVGTLEFA